MDSWETVYGWVRKGPRFYDFYLQVELGNGLLAFRRVRVARLEVETARLNVYKFVLDGMVREIDEQVQGRL